MLQHFGDFLEEFATNTPWQQEVIDPWFRDSLKQVSGSLETFFHHSIQARLTFCRQHMPPTGRGEWRICTSGDGVGGPAGIMGGY